MKVFEHYLVDTVSITKLNSDQLQSSFFQDHCKVTDENLYELRTNRDYKFLKEIEYKVNIDILKMLSIVWDKVTITDNIIDLFNNKGNADIIIIGVLLYETEKHNGKLIQTDEWVIVTDDRNLTDLARKFSFKVIDTNTFIDIISKNS